MPDKTHYELLEVSRSAGEDEIRDQYRLQMYKYHPDHNPGNEEWAVAQTVALVEACKTLCDPQARRLYDFSIAWKPREQGETGGLALFKGKDKKEAEQRFAEGLRLCKDGKVLPSIEAYKQALRLEPAFSDAAFNLALLLALNNHAHMGLDLLLRACKADPKDEGLVKLKNSIAKTFLGA